MTTKMKCRLCKSEWIETYPNNHRLYGVCPGPKPQCPANRLEKTGEVIQND